MTLPVLPYVPDPEDRFGRAIIRIGSHWVWLSIAVAFGLIALIWAAEWGPTRPGHTDTGQPARVMYPWVMAILVIGIVVMMLSLVLILGYRQSQWATNNANLRSQRVARLTQSLTEALAIIEGIKREVEDGEALLQRLKADTEVSKQLAALTEEQAAAVNSALGLALRRESRRSIPISVLINVGCGIVGLVIGHFVF